MVYSEQHLTDLRYLTRKWVNNNNNLFFTIPYIIWGELTLMWVWPVVQRLFAKHFHFVEMALSSWMAKIKGIIIKREVHYCGRPLPRIYELNILRLHSSDYLR